MLTFRVPTGADQRAYAEGVREGVEPDLLEMCLLQDGNSDQTHERLSFENRAKIEEALDTVAPDVSTRLLTECPDCQQSQQIEFNAYQDAWLPAENLLDEVHAFAFW